MTTESLPPALAQARAAFDDLVRDIRPQLHRYCAWMTGSVVDGEDIVQDTLARAYYVLPTVTPVGNLSAWLFRIAHNKAVDHLRRRDRWRMEPLDDLPPLADPDPPLADRALTDMALSRLLRLAPMQRSCVFLKDVMGYSLAEISELLDVSVGAVKAALHRGRARLRELADKSDADVPVQADPAEVERLARYVDRFNARDFDALRAMLADDVRLDLIGRAQRRGATAVGGYFDNYAAQHDWRFGLGFVEGRLAVLATDPGAPSADPVYFVLLDWRDDGIASIRDYRYARHVMRHAEIAALPA